MILFKDGITLNEDIVTNPIIGKKSLKLLLLELIKKKLETSTSRHISIIGFGKKLKKSLI